MNHNNKVKQLSLATILTILSLSSCKLIAQEKQEDRIQKKAYEALKYCQENNLNTKQCVLIDMNIHSGKYRLFVWDFLTNKIIQQGICCHGSCDGSTGPGYTPYQPKFNNTSSSFCSSLGKYKIGKRGWSNWGINVNYKLHGLETTNSKAFERIIVLHSYTLVPNKECFPEYAPTSWGCPMVSDEMMRYLDKRLKTNENCLMWVFE